MVKWTLAGGTIQGNRAYQQDSIAHIVSSDQSTAIIVVCDGVGGGGYGNIASKTVIDKCAALLAPRIDVMAERQIDIPEILRSTVHDANNAVAAKAKAHPQTEGMGTTLVIAVLCRRTLYWCSVGDSHLALVRKKALTRLNADHSLASGLDDMVKIGAIDAEAARQSGKSSVLTSAVSGDGLNDIDCPERGTDLHPDDLVLVYSDGVETLSASEIAETCRRTAAERPATIVGRLLDDIESRARHGQDNASVVVASGTE